MNSSALTSGAPKDDRLLASEDKEKDAEAEAGRDRDDERKYSELVSLCREFLATAAR